MKWETMFIFSEMQVMLANFIGILCGLDKCMIIISFILKPSAKMRLT